MSDDVCVRNWTTGIRWIACMLCTLQYIYIHTFSIKEKWKPERITVKKIADLRCNFIFKKV